MQKEPVFKAEIDSFGLLKWAFPSRLLCHYIHSLIIVNLCGNVWPI